MAPLQRSKSASQTGQLQIQHFIHQHVLHKLNMTTEFNCDGCNTAGSGVRYHCSGCDFDIHEQCATAPHRISSNLHPHPHHHLVLVNRPGDSHVCHVCKGLTNGLSYTCEITPACVFNVHVLCILTADKSLTLVPTTSLGCYNGVSNHLNNNNNQPATSFGGYNGVSNGQPVMVNHHQQQHQMQGMHTTSFGGYQNNSQPTMVNHQQQQLSQGIIPTATTSFGGNYHGVSNHLNNNNNNQAQMINQQQQQGFGGYHGGMNSQPVMVNRHQQQQQMMPTTSFNANQQFMTNHHQQIQHQQQQGMAMPPTAIGGGYSVVNNNQTVMISQPPPPPPPPPPPQSNGYSKMGRMAANILSTSIIGVPLFMNRG